MSNDTVQTIEPINNTADDSEGFFTAALLQRLLDNLIKFFYLVANTIAALRRRLLENLIELFDLVADAVVALQIATYFKKIYFASLGINAGDAILGSISGLFQVIEAQSAKRHRKEKTMWGALEIFFGLQILAFGTVAALITTGVIVGAAALAGVILFSFAACSILINATIRSLRKTFKSWSKCDPQTLIADRDYKKNLIQSKIEQLNSKLEQTSDNDIQIKLSDEIAYLEQTYRRLAFQSTALQKFADEKKGTLKESFSPKERAVATHLLSKQRKKTKHAVVCTAEWGIAATGVLLASFSPLCPALALPGVILSALASISQLINLLSKLPGYLKLKLMMHDTENEILKKTTASSTIIGLIKQTARAQNNQNIFSFLTNLQGNGVKEFNLYCKKLYIAYKQSNFFNAEDEENGLREFLNEHFQAKGKNQKNILKQSLNQAASDQTIKAHLTLSKEDNINEFISEKDSTSVLHQAKQNFSVYNSLYNKVKTFFNDKPLQEDNALKMDDNKGIVDLFAPFPADIRLN